MAKKNKTFHYGEEKLNVGLALEIVNTPIRDSSRACVVSERSALKYSVRHKVLREKRIKKTFSLKSTALGETPGMRQSLKKPDSPLEIRNCEA